MGDSSEAPMGGGDRKSAQALSRMEEATLAAGDAVRGVGPREWGDTDIAEADSVVAGTEVGTAVK